MMSPVARDYGLGVIVMGRGARRIITHGGTNEGFQSRFMALLDGSGEGLVIMTNGDNGGALAAAIQRTLAEAYGFDWIRRRAGAASAKRAGQLKV
jgi:hypothetical protein